MPRAARLRFQKELHMTTKLPTLVGLVLAMALSLGASATANARPVYRRGWAEPVRAGWHRGWNPGVYWRAPVRGGRPGYYGHRY